MCPRQHPQERTLCCFWNYPPNERQSWSPNLACPQTQNLGKNVMIIGADVHHKAGKLSTIGFVASMNDKIS